MGWDPQAGGGWWGVERAVISTKVERNLNTYLFQPCNEQVVRLSLHVLT